MKNTLDIIELKKDLKKSYNSFFQFSLSLIEDLESTNNNLQFAVVNMQISLELFLKYYFLEIGKEYLVFKKGTTDFKSFDDILGNVFKDKTILISKKKLLKQILQSRNNIVHQGGHNKWSDDLANSLINCTLFMQGLHNKEFNTSLIPESYDVNDYSANSVWKNGAEGFAHNIAELNKTNVYECIYCYSNAMVNKKLFNLDEFDDQGFQCVVCLRNLTINDEIQLANCKACGEDSFIIDHLNKQSDGSYGGCCINCGIKYFAFHCKNCEKYFMDFDDERLIEDNMIFCKQQCFLEHKTAGNNC